MPLATWKRYALVLLGTLAGLLALAVGLVAVANPYGNLAFSPLAHVLMDDNQRFQYPAVIRSGRYDSLVIGTSTARLLEPAELERHFGGRFANLALNSGTAWEQWQIARLFARTVAQPRTILVGIDWVWCAHDADTQRVTIRGFPDWMFDDNPWNDLAYMLNPRSIEIASRRIWHALGRVKERWPHNGYEVFVPPESAYDLERARKHIYERPPPDGGRPRRPDVKLPPDGFPALAWIEDILASRRFERVILALMPVHVAAQPKEGGIVHAREQLCKSRLARLAKPHGVPVIDFRIASRITREDANYWDPLHYRVPVATRLVAAIARAIETKADDPAGDWRIVATTP
jgi:hypothetical protein